MEEIDIKEILYYMFKKKLFIILVTIIGVTAGALYTKFLVTPMYSATTTVVLTSSSDTITQSDVTLNSKLVSTYSEILQSRSVAQEVKEELNLSISEESLMSNISVTEESDTEMLKITVQNEDPVIAANVANALSDVFTRKVMEIYNIENVTVIDTAIANYTPVNTNYIKNAGLFGAIALVGACGIVFLFFYFDTKIKSKSEVEELLGLDILAVIPEIKN